MGYSIGVDIGGTFSDCVAVNEQGQVFHGKALSTHATNPVEGVLNGLERLAEETGEGAVEALLAKTVEFSHGTTIGTNLMVERKGARVGLVATKGHGDALQIMRGRGRTAGVAPELLLNVRATDKPAALVPNQDVVEVAERILADGTVLASLNDDEAREILRPLLEEVDAVAIALLWSFRNPVHEQRLREIIYDIRPDMYVSISSETAPRLGEYERTVATVINSYVGPASSRYLERLADELRERGLTAPVFIMQSNGGVLPVAAARQRPIQTIGSGPAGGLAATQMIAARSGHSNVIATDMGGTSFEVGLLVNGRPVLTSENVIDQYTYKIPQLDLRSIACGGGSIASVDPHSGGLRVGPESAGSNPGPACYGQGTRATVTDADVVLGLIDPDRFLGSQMTLDKEAATAAVQRIADEAGLSLVQAASGILRVNSQSAAVLIRQRTVEQGLDPRDFTLYAFGGAGPLHAFAFADELDVAQVVIPLGNGASTLSAYGIAASDAMEVFEEESVLRAPFDQVELAAVIARLEDRAREQMTAAGFPADRITLTRSGQARYAEQYMQELVLPMPDGEINQGFVDELSAIFSREYARLYSAAALSVLQAPEIFTVRVTASVSFETPETAAPTAGSTAPSHTRDVYWPGHETWVSTDVYDGAPAPSVRINGPALVQLPHTTIAVAPGQALETDSHANCILHMTGQEGR